LSGGNIASRNEQDASLQPSTEDPSNLLAGTTLQLDISSRQHPPVEAQLQTALNLIPAFAWYCNASGALTFLNERGSDYLGLPKDHPLRHGIDTGAEWDSHISLLHPDDHEEARTAWSTRLRTGSPGDVSFRVRNAEGGYRWHLSRAEVQMSYSHFARAFKQSMGISPNVYMTEQRIERAKKLLSDTDLRIADIALRTGFASQSHFTSTFRKLVWTTPKAFRDSL
jgi:AraC-like DNA-binding protein